MTEQNSWHSQDAFWELMEPMPRRDQLDRNTRRGTHRTPGIDPLVFCRRAVLAAGNLRVYGSLAGIEYNQAAQRLVVVGRK